MEVLNFVSYPGTPLVVVTQDKPAFAAITLGSILLLWIGSYTLSAVERIPLIPKALEFVGLLYTSTFFYKYVLFADGRVQLGQELDALKRKTTTAADDTKADADEATTSDSEGGDESPSSVADVTPAKWDEGSRAQQKPGRKSGRKTESLLAETDNGRYEQQSKFEKITSAEESKGPGAALRSSGDDFDEAGSAAVTSTGAWQEALGVESSGNEAKDREAERKKMKELGKNL
ncbi:MAG: hypothetical protein WDW36_008725 [Sanguina aurantia]